MAAAEPEALRADIRGGRLRGDALASLLESLPASERDAWVERLLGITAAPDTEHTGHGELIGHHASGVGALLQLIRDVPIRASDVFVDLGSGLGKATMLVHLLTGAKAIGLELDSALLDAARQRARDFGLGDVAYVQGDAREAVPEGTVYYLYLPFTGAALDAAMARLEAATRGRTVVVCTLGLDLSRWPWLRGRESSDFWTGIYDRVS
ncbi:class I SAM-dependent methyltransferase [Pyxidicoccus parkwayensis]|uniref:Class I SAM-dependent methyltransferase n=1 Tax=Pyxidicoccus parkwayensis TaxID=2813578 RepID=A0ABX7PA50_9BACT|nr:class I SAM-dependent methyltransferase [Pyxidicoccus parkwaysis]QSQ27399.1 class I SAM-dependent methyltransferase [Pyxidicoccus parkwaysis]